MMKSFKFFIIVSLLFAFRFFIASILPLGNDEVYYLLYARYPSYHYYDHPLLVGWFLKLFSFDFRWESLFFYRLFALILSIPTVILIYKSMLHIATQRAAQIAVLLFGASIYNSIIAGVFVMPDAPMLFFWVLSIYLALITFFNREKSQEINHNYFFPLCISLGLTCLSKFHGVFLVLGILAFIFYYRSSFLRSWTFWEGIIILILMSFPVIYWNIQNDWVQFDFYRNRVPASQQINLNGLLKELMGQFAYNNPVVVLFIFTFGILNFAKIKRINKKAFLLCVSLPFIVFVLLLSLFKETLPHWSGPSYIGLIMLASLISDEITQNIKITAWIFSALSLWIVVCISGLLLIFNYPGTLGQKKDALRYGSGDFTLDMYGWSASGNLVYQELNAHKLQHLPVLSSNWFPAAHIDHSIIRQTHQSFYVIGDITKTHHYKWVNEIRGGWPVTDSALTIIPSNYYIDPTISFGSSFNTIKKISSIPQYRGGQLVRYFHLYLLTASVKQ